MKRVAPLAERDLPELPEEVWQLIFLQCGQDYKHRITITLVCRAFREWLCVTIRELSEIESGYFGPLLPFMPNLEELDLTYGKKITHHNINQLPVSNLKKLSLQSNRTFLGEGLLLLTNLTSLRLYDNWTIKDQHLLPLTKLSFLDLEHAQSITNLSSLTTLTSLKLRQNHKVFNHGISRLEKLTNLNVSHNRKISDDALPLLTNL